MSGMGLPSAQARPATAIIRFARRLTVVADHGYDTVTTRSSYWTGLKFKTFPFDVSRSDRRWHE